LAEELEPGHRQLFFERDFDGLWFINPFSIGLTPRDADALAEDGYCPFEESLKKLGALIELEVSRLTDVGQLAKWNWLKTQHSNAVVEFAKLGQPRFWHAWKTLEASKRNSAAPFE
jgi:hypothetical protein